MVDGIDLAKLGLRDVRGRAHGIAIITQDPLVFSGPIRFTLDPFEQHSDEEIEQKLHGRCETVGHEVVDAREDLSRDYDSIHDSAQSFLSQYNIGSRSSGISTSLNTDANIRNLHSRGIIDSITGHATLVPELSQHIDNDVLVFGKYLSKCVCTLD